MKALDRVRALVGCALVRAGAQLLGDVPAVGEEPVVADEAEPMAQVDLSAEARRMVEEGARRKSEAPETVPEGPLPGSLAWRRQQSRTRV